MSTPTVAVVTGASRGIGLAITTGLASRDNTVVYAGVRKSSPELDALVEKSNGRVKLLSISSADVDGNKAAAAQVKQEHGYVNLLIANAGTLIDPVSVLESNPEAYEVQYRVNTIGPIVLYQAFYPLLVETKDPKFVAISTLGGSINLADVLPYKFPGYAASKVALNLLIRTIHGQTEKEGLITFPLHPGEVDTAGGNVAFDVVKKLGVNVEPITAEHSAAGILKVIDEATRATHGAKFIGYDGAECPW